VRFQVLTAASMMFRTVFWVDNYFTRQYIPEDNSELDLRCLYVLLLLTEAKGPNREEATLFLP
jgi:hypothetical protein